MVIIKNNLPPLTCKALNELILPISTHQLISPASALILNVPSRLAFILYLNQAKFCPASQPLLSVLPLTEALFLQIFA